MDVGLYTVSIENSQPIEWGRDIQPNVLALVQYLENFVRPVLCLYLGCTKNPFILVLHFKIKLF